MLILAHKGVWSIGNLLCTQPEWPHYCYSHNPALFETFTHAADRCCWQKHLEGLPVHKLIGENKGKEFVHNRSLDKVLEGRSTKTASEMMQRSLKDREISKQRDFILSKQGDINM